MWSNKELAAGNSPAKRVTKSTERILLFSAMAPCVCSSGWICGYVPAEQSGRGGRGLLQ